ncbi:tumor necrosis factor receptor superfamily member 13B [Amia ocellicauda]|uniref:tumor necrosis factor receptor superfamily member 13B n=1 Tax=Amia ocellicauda TaxID=2972642 RepID=UPI00346386F4
MERCPDTMYHDTLLRKCIPCKDACEQNLSEKCIPFCVVLQCESTPGNYYDKLLDQCLQCSEVCASNIKECSAVCQQPTLVSPMQRPVGEGLTEHHAAIIYFLLGLSLAVLMCTLSVALLVLVKKMKRTKIVTPFESKEPSKLPTRSSKDHLLESGGPLETDAWRGASKPTETCLYCFPELKAVGRAEGKHTEASPIYQQAAPTTPLITGTAISTPYEKDRTFKIICSPSQTST